MSARILTRADQSRPFGFHPRPGKPAKPEQTISLARAAILKVSGKVSADGKSVTVAAVDATPRALVLTNVLVYSTSYPAGKVPASGYVLPDETLREIIDANGWSTLHALYPIDDRKPDASGVDPDETAAFVAYLKALGVADKTDLTVTSGTDADTL